MINMFTKAHNAFFFREPQERVSGFDELLDNKDNIAFFKAMRISHECFASLLQRLPWNEPEDGHTGGRIPVGKKSTLYIGLWYLGNSSTFREISEQFGIAESTVHGCVSRVIDALCALAPSVIKWPSITEMDETAGRFEEVSGMPGVLGAIDGCHIPIMPPKEFQADYLDRTMKHSMNLMAVCDSRRRLTFVSCGFPGSAHDQRVLSRSPLWEYIEKSESNAFFPSTYYHLVGDSAFTLVEHLMVPYKDSGNLTVEQAQFNHKLSKARHIIENCFAWLKERFRKLKLVNADVERVPKIILACCVLHNIALEFPDFEVLRDVRSSIEASQVEPNMLRDDHRGKVKRDAIARAMS